MGNCTDGVHGLVRPASSELDTSPPAALEATPSSLLSPAESEVDMRPSDKGESVSSSSESSRVLTAESRLDAASLAREALAILAKHSSNA